MLFLYCAGDFNHRFQSTWALKGSDRILAFDVLHHEVVRAYVVNLAMLLWFRARRLSIRPPGTAKRRRKSP